MSINYAVIDVNGVFCLTIVGLYAVDGIVLDLGKSDGQTRPSKERRTLFDAHQQ